MKNSQKLLQKITSRKVVQKSRLCFVLKNALWWSLFVLSVIIGSLAFSVIIFAFYQTDFISIFHVHHFPVELFLGLLPLFWIFSLLFFLFFAIFGVRHTKTGYRYSLFLVFGSSIVFSVIFGTLLFFVGGAKEIEYIFARTVPLYKSIEEKKVAHWLMPEAGFLSGNIITKNNKTLILRDWKGRIWKVYLKNTLIRKEVLLEKEKGIKIIGRIMGKNGFIAEEIRPWKGGGIKKRK